MKKNILGQHFLRNKAILKKIASSLELKPDETVIEIGAGHGELTNELRIADSESRIIAIEKDPLLAEKLKEKFRNDNLTRIIRGDALKILPNLICDSPLADRKYKIAGNIPYYITGHLLREIGELEKKLSLSVFMTQKEVAERICAQPPRMNRLAASVQFWGKPQIIECVSKKHFSPQPDVDSAIIKIESRDKSHEAREAKNYYRTVRKIFAQPRKTILNNLLVKNKNQKEREELPAKLEKICINPSDRPQNLSVEEIISIANG